MNSQTSEEEKQICTYSQAGRWQIKQNKQKMKDEYQNDRTSRKNNKS